MSVCVFQLKQGRASITMPFSEILNLLPSDTSGRRDDYLAYQTILVVANVTERVTGKVLSGNDTTQCHRQMYQLEFLDITPDSYKPGLDFTGYVSLVRQLFLICFQKKVF